MRRLRAHDGLFVTKLQRKRLHDLKAGVSLVQRTGYAIDEVIARTTKDRLDLARQHLLAAQRMLRLRPPDYRDAVSRGYYSLYHTFRATVFFLNSGDDYHEHSVLPDHIPSDFPNVKIWKNELKTARLERNRADYDPYPSANNHLENSASCIVELAEELLPTARLYLRSKGWTP